MSQRKYGLWFANAFPRNIDIPADLAKQPGREAFLIIVHVSKKLPTFRNMSNTTKFIIKIVMVCLIYIPIKLTLMTGRDYGFLADFLVAFFAFAIAHGIIYIIESRNAE